MCVSQHAVDERRGAPRSLYKQHTFTRKTADRKKEKNVKKMGNNDEPHATGSDDGGAVVEEDAVPPSFSPPPAAAAPVTFNTTVTASNVPTVLSKLRKWGDYASYGDPVKPSR